MSGISVKSGLFALLLLTSSTAAGWDYCFEVACGDCDNFTPQDIFADYDPLTGWASGIVQASADEWGVAVVGRVVAETDNVYFARRADGGAKLYFYEINLGTFAGTRLGAIYNLDQGIDYQEGTFRSHALALIPCPQ